MPYVLILLLLLGGALTFGLGSSVTPAQVGPPMLWAACRDVPDTECAGLEVPIDPARPDGLRLTIRLARARAADAAHDNGVLLLIPGGPGVGIDEAFGQFRTLQHINEFARQFDVVSFDPRGVGQSSPVRCNPNVLPPPPRLSTAPPRSPNSRSSLMPTPHSSRAVSRRRAT